MRSPAQKKAGFSRTSAETVALRTGKKSLRCGNLHSPQRSLIRIPGSGIPVFGIPSASAAGVHSDYPSAYNEYALDTSQSAWQLRAHARCWNASTRVFETESLGEFAIGNRG